MLPTWVGKYIFGHFREKGHFGSLKIFLVQKGFLLILNTLFEVQGSYWEYMFSMTVGNHVFRDCREKGHFGSLKKFLVQKGFLLIPNTLFEIRSSYKGFKLTSTLSRNASLEFLRYK